MITTITDIQIYQGDTPAWNVTVLADDGSPANISAYTAKAQIRRAPADADEVVAAEMTAVVESPYVHLSLTAEQTTPLTGRYVWDLELTGPSGEVTTIMYGKVAVKAEVTRATA